MIEFAWPYLFFILPLPLLIAWLSPRAVAQPSAGLRVPFFAALANAGAPLQQSRSWLRLLTAVGAWLLLVIAACRPQFVGEPLDLPVSGRDLLLAVDISGSMQTEDMRLSGRSVTRLRAVKAVASDFISRREGDRVGLILFGSRAYLQTPLTLDRATVRTLLYESAIGLAGKETAIGDAIGLAVKRLRERPEENRVLILLTDGANTAGAVEPLIAADLAAQAGVRIYTIGVGADNLALRGYFSGRRVNPATELDESTLVTIAEKTDGHYFRARDTQGLLEIYRLLDRLEPVAADAVTFRPTQELYIWPLAAALSLTALLALAASLGRF